VQNFDTIQVRLWDQDVGYLAKRTGGAAFEFEPGFKASSLEIAPIEMPLSTTTIYTSRETNNTFFGLPGVIADCLPDRFGMNAIEGFFKKNYGFDPPRVSILHRLLYLGSRAMGALEFLPPADDKLVHCDFLQLRTLLEAAKKTLAGEAAGVAAEILRVSASPGGRQAKALVDFNPTTLELRSGFAPAAPGFIPCILKLDGTRDDEDTNVYGRLEHVYALMASLCGIDMPKTYLLPGESENGPLAHFVVERFDRLPNKAKPFHYSSLCGLLLRDYREKHSASYEDYFELTKLLTVDATQTAQAFRRAVFNIAFRNQDDHTKNFGFVMNPKGGWRLAPAFDLTYVYGVGVSATHQMTLANKDEGFSREDLVRAGKVAGLRKAQVTEILEKTKAAMDQFAHLAERHGLEDPFVTGVKSRFRLL